MHVGEGGFLGREELLVVVFVFGADEVSELEKVPETTNIESFGEFATVSEILWSEDVVQSFAEIIRLGMSLRKVHFSFELGETPSSDTGKLSTGRGNEIWRWRSKLSPIVS